MAGGRAGLNVEPDTKLPRPQRANTSKYKVIASFREIKRNIMMRICGIMLERKTLGMG
jgi:hypothetical protein